MTTSTRVFFSANAGGVGLSQPLSKEHTAIIKTKAVGKGPKPGVRKLE
jgi:hypothetical protein